MKTILSKKSIIIISSVLFIALQSSCSMNNSKLEEPLHNASVDKLKSNCSNISPETASLIAKGYMFLDYDLSDREAKVESETELWKDKGEMWKVTLYKTKNQDAFSGAPIVWVFKGTGEIFTVKHDK